MGKHYSEWGDCYHVVAHLEPKLKGCITDYGAFLSTPFDPYNEKYYTRSRLFGKLYHRVKTMELPDKIRRVFLNTKDLVFNEENNGETRTVTRCFFQTRKDYTCNG